MLNHKRYSGTFVEFSVEDVFKLDISSNLGKLMLSYLPLQY